VVNLVSLIIAPIIVQYKTFNAVMVVIVLALVLVVVWAIRTSKREVPAVVAVQAMGAPARVPGNPHE